MSPLTKAKSLIDEAWENTDRWHDLQVEARDILRTAVDESPDDPVLLTAYGTVLCDLNEYSLAAPVLEEAIRLGSRDANTYFALAVVAFNHPLPARRPGTFRRPDTLFSKASSLSRSSETWEAHFDFQAQ